MNASEVNAGIVVASDTSSGLMLNTHYKSLANMGDACPAGRYGLLMAPFKLCPLCPAGAAAAGLQALGSSGHAGREVCRRLCWLQPPP